MDLLRLIFGPFLGLLTGVLLIQLACDGLREHRDLRKPYWLLYSVALSVGIAFAGKYSAELGRLF